MPVLLHTTDLRVHDNPAVTRAATHNAVKPVYIWDDDFLDPYGDHYKDYLRTALKRLNEAYNRRGSHLTVLHDDIEGVVNGFNETIYINPPCVEGSRRQTIDAVLNQDHVKPVHDEPREAIDNADSNAKITAYLQSNQRPAPSTIPANPLPENVQRTNDVPKDTLSLTVFNHHADDYLNIVSNPSKSREKTTRISQHLCTGQISLRHAYQTIKTHHGDHPVLNRLRWNIRFKHKLQKNPDLHREPINEYFNEHTPYNHDDERIQAWKDGRTGHPLVDASMRCLNKTGYLNFRMRALLASYLTHVLRQPWWIGAKHMHHQLIDAEPAINHYQWQMQSNMVGVHPLRIYNPTKQAQDHDENATFIQRWVPELQGLPADHAIKPWDTPKATQQTEFTPGADYPERIVQYDDAQQATTTWFDNRLPEITKGILKTSNDALLSNASQRRLRRLKDKYLNASLSDFT